MFSMFSRKMSALGGQMSAPTRKPHKPMNSIIPEPDPPPPPTKIQVEIINIDPTISELKIKITKMKKMLLVMFGEEKKGQWCSFCHNSIWGKMIFGILADHSDDCELNAILMEKEE